MEWTCLSSVGTAALLACSSEQQQLAAEPQLFQLRGSKQQVSVHQSDEKPGVLQINLSNGSNGPMHASGHYI